MKTKSCLLTGMKGLGLLLLLFGIGFFLATLDSQVPMFVDLKLPPRMGTPTSSAYMVWKNFPDIIQSSVRDTAYSLHKESPVAQEIQTQFLEESEPVRLMIRQGLELSGYAPADDVYGQNSHNKDAAIILAGRVRLYMARENIIEALDDLLLLLKFEARLLSRPQNLLEYMFSKTHGYELVLRLLESHALTATQLQELRKQLSRMPSEAESLRVALQGEFHMQWQYLRDYPGEQEKVEGGFMVHPLMVAYGIHPNRAAQHLAQLYRQAIMEIPLPECEVDFDVDTIVAEMYENRYRHLRKPGGMGILIGTAYLPAMDTMLHKQKRRQCTVDLAQIAVAIEHYYIENEAYPSTLQDLIPRFMESLPVDPYDHEPYRYAVGRIYSQGSQVKDEEGELLWDPEVSVFRLRIVSE